MRRGLVIAAATLMVLVGGGLMLREVRQPPPDRLIETSLYGVQGQLLAENPPVVGFSPEPLPKDLDVTELGQPAPIEPLTRPVDATGSIASQAYGSTFVLGAHAGVPMHVFRQAQDGWWDRIVGRETVQHGVCFDAGTYGFCTTAEQLQMVDTTEVWGPSSEAPGPGRRIGIWAPVPEGTAVVGLEVDGEPVAWQAPSGPAAVIVFDHPGTAEMVAYDPAGEVIRAFSDPRS